ncbi:MAG: hypothetical protein K6G91_11185 [Kiritimatiellae bacterium]|nr:hypothetical protein [Kiritimatiellia bacterium]
MTGTQLARQSYDSLLEKLRLVLYKVVYKILAVKIGYIVEIARDLVCESATVIPVQCRRNVNALDLGKPEDDPLLKFLQISLKGQTPSVCRGGGGEILRNPISNVDFENIRWKFPFPTYEISVSNV